MVGAVTDEEKQSADSAKRRKLPLLTRSTLWLMILWSTPVLIGISAALLLPIAMRPGIRPIAETNAIMSSVGLAVDAYRQEYGQLPSSVNHDLVNQLAGQNAKGIPFMDFSRRRRSTPSARYLRRWSTSAKSWRGRRSRSSRTSSSPAATSARSRAWLPRSRRISRRSRSRKQRSPGPEHRRRP